MKGKTVHKDKAVDVMTNDEVGMHALLYALDGADPSAAIELQESQGQRSFVSSDTIPRRGATDEELGALGFTLGAPVDSDELFRFARLPEGWIKRSTDHSMYSEIVDEQGRRRVSIFYKAAFYDRDAFLRIVKLEDEA